MGFSRRGESRQDVFEKLEDLETSDCSTMASFWRSDPSADLLKELDYRAPAKTILRSLKLTMIDQWRDSVDREIRQIPDRETRLVTSRLATEIWALKEQQLVDQEELKELRDQQKVDKMEVAELKEKLKAYETRR